MKSTEFHPADYDSHGRLRLPVLFWCVLLLQAFLGGPGLYEIVPGFVAAMIAIVAVSAVTRVPGPRATP